jgi:hypothetical protein
MEAAAMLSRPFAGHGLCRFERFDRLTSSGDSIALRLAICAGLHARFGALEIRASFSQLLSGDLFCACIASGSDGLTGIAHFLNRCTRARAQSAAGNERESSQRAMDREGISHAVGLLTSFEPNNRPPTPSRHAPLQCARKSACSSVAFHPHLQLRAALLTADPGVSSGA